MEPSPQGQAPAVRLSASGGDIAAVCCFFNPCRYRSRGENYRRFRANVVQSGIPLLTVELAFGDAPFEFSAESDLLQIRGSDVMWQKERLLQLGGEVLLHAGYRKLVMLDADVLFDDLSWPERVSRALDAVPIAQCFSVAEHHYADQVQLQPSIAYAHLHEGITRSVAPGLAWGIRSEVFCEVGLFEYCVVGGGDSALAHGALGLAHDSTAWDTNLRHRGFMRDPGPAMLAAYQAWARRLVRVTAGEFGYVDGKVISLPHGAKSARNYPARHRLLAGFEPELEVTSIGGGPFVWTRAGAHRRDAVARYFFERDEDVPCSAPFSEPHRTTVFVPAASGAHAT
jgi:hypothetical protein